MHPILAAVASIIMNVFVAITGVLPSAFITAWTIALFGFEIGLILLIVGEALGAIISFILYRKGVKLFSRKAKKKKLENKFLRRLKQTAGTEAFFLVILLRLLPFVPSGFVTLAAAVSKMGFLHFSIASTLGKIPALYIESYSVYYVMNLQSAWQIALVVLVVFGYLLYLFFKKQQ
ncbi:TVP38/TMEM64 family protein [Bacillus sp. B15-48]|nr:TVP38/TMEM64 family protein [Bacillus sp. B15-48]